LSEGARASALSFVMHDSGSWHTEDQKSPARNPAAHLDIDPVESEAFIHPAQLARQLGAYHHRGRRQNFSFKRLCAMFGAALHVLFVPSVIGKDSREPRASTKDAVHYRWKTSYDTLVRTIGV